MPGWAWALIVDRRRRRRGASSSGRRCERGARARCTAGSAHEYDRTLTRARRASANAESELAARADRRDELEITPLPPGARERYVERMAARAGTVRGRSGRRCARGRHADPVRDVGPRLPDGRLRPAGRGRLRRPSAGGRELPEGNRLTRASALGDGTTEDFAGPCSTTARSSTSSSRNARRPAGVVAAAPRTSRTAGDQTPRASATPRRTRSRRRALHLWRIQRLDLFAGLRASDPSFRIRNTR